MAPAEVTGAVTKEPALTATARPMRQSTWDRAVGEAGGPCYEDFTCDGDLTCVKLGGPGICTDCPLENILRNDAPTPEFFREFRDTRLMKSELGREVVRFYYMVGPWTDAVLYNSPMLRVMARETLEMLGPMIESVQ